MLIQRNKNKFLSFLLFVLFFTNFIYASEEIDRYFLPEQHWLNKKMDQIFTSKSVLKDEASFEKAGFKILHHQDTGMKVARHPLLPGYLVKAYLSKKQPKDMDWAVNRCIGVERIRNLIQEENLTCFSVPEKWIYVVAYPNPTEVVLVVQDMELVSNKESQKAWKNASKKELKALYTVLSHGYGSCSLVGNIPYTKKGKFTFIDTAYPYRKFDLTYPRKFFSSEGQAYWDKLVKEGKSS